MKPARQSFFQLTIDFAQADLPKDPLRTAFFLDTKPFVVFRDIQRPTVAEVKRLLHAGGRYADGDQWCYIHAASLLLPALPIFAISSHEN